MCDIFALRNAFNLFKLCKIFHFKTSSGCNNCNIRLFSLHKNPDQAKLAVISSWLYYPWHY